MSQQKVARPMSIIYVLAQRHYRCVVDVISGTPCPYIHFINNKIYRFFCRNVRAIWVYFGSQCLSAGCIYSALCRILLIWKSRIAYNRKGRHGLLKMEINWKCEEWIQSQSSRRFLYIYFHHALNCAQSKWRKRAHINIRWRSNLIQVGVVCEQWRADPFFAVIWLSIGSAHAPWWEWRAVIRFPRFRPQQSHEMDSWGEMMWLWWCVRGCAREMSFRADWRIKYIVSVFELDILCIFIRL